MAAAFPVGSAAAFAYARIESGLPVARSLSYQPVSTKAVARSRANFAGLSMTSRLREQLACARDPALYRPDRHLTDRRRFVIGKARRSDQKQRLALNMRQLRQRLDELLEFQAAELLGGQFQAGQVAAIRILDFAAPLAILRSK